MASKTILKNIRIGKHVTGIASSCFAPCVNLSEVYIPSTVTTIGKSAFAGFSNLQKVQFTEQTTEQASAAHNLWNTGLRMPTAIDKNGNVISIIEPISYTTLYYSNGTSASFLQSTFTWSEVGKSSSYAANTSVIQAIGGINCTTIGSFAFGSCYSLTTASFSACTTIENHAFTNCSNLTTVSFPTCMTICTKAFQACSNLTTASFATCTSIYMGAFSRCYGLMSVNFPNCTIISSVAFNFCNNLAIASFQACEMIGSFAFNNCYLLISLYLTSSSVCSLANSNAFEFTPIEGYTEYTSGVLGSIFVPQSLVTEYQNATNWTYFSERFVGI